MVWSSGLFGRNRHSHNGDCAFVISELGDSLGFGFWIWVFLGCIDNLGMGIHALLRHGWLKFCETGQCRARSVLSRPLPAMIFLSGSWFSPDNCVFDLVHLIKEDTPEEPDLGMR